MLMAPEPSTGHCQYYNLLLQTSLIMSVYMTISLTVERYMSVVYPLINVRHHSCLYLAVPGMVFSILFTLPNYFMLNTKTRTMVKNMNLDMSDLHKVILVHASKLGQLVMF